MKGSWKAGIIEKMLPYRKLPANSPELQRVLPIVAAQAEAFGVAVPDVKIEQGFKRFKVTTSRVTSQVVMRKSGPTPPSWTIHLDASTIRRLNDLALTAIISHEMAHIACGHGLPDNSQKRSIFETLRQSRTNEFQADWLAAKSMGTTAGLKLYFNQSQHRNPISRRLGAGLEKFLTHPSTSSRIAAMVEIDSELALEKTEVSVTKDSDT